MKKTILVLIGVILSFICLELFLQVTSFIIRETVKYKNHKNLQTKFNNNDTITILCAGESTTYEQWPEQLELYLKNNSNKHFKILQSALPALNIEELLARSQDMIERYEPNIVISMMGVNDASFDKNKKQQIFKKYSLKTILLLNLIKEHLSSKLNTNKDKSIFSDIQDDNSKLNVVSSNNSVTENKNQSNDMYSYMQKNYSEYLTKEPIEIINKLHDDPDNFSLIKSLVEIYVLKKDLYNVKKNFNIYLNMKNLDIENNLYLWNTVINFCAQNNDFEYLEHLIKTILKSTNNKDLINHLFCMSLSRYIMIDTTIEQFVNIYNLLIKYKINSSVVVYLHEYLSSNGIKVSPINYEITFINKPNFNKDKIKNSYLKLAKLLNKKQICYICMSYPTISINIFKKFFEDTNLCSNIIFVSNEHNFNDYLKNNSYSSVFIDQFGGTFGHCNDLGNTMIAENVGKVIINLTNKN